MEDKDPFATQVVSWYPRLHVWALALCRNKANADDLVQDTLLKALNARDQFTLDTNLSAWLHRIMFNVFITWVRNTKKFAKHVELDNPDEDYAKYVSVEPDQEWGIYLSEMSQCLDDLSNDQRDALIGTVLEGKTLETLSAELGVAIGTLKSRVHRARLVLQQFV